jgi:hypothetical protein
MYTDRDDVPNSKLFEFECDNNALQSILENRGVTRAPGLTPAKHIPDSLSRNNDKLEFFEGAGGAVYFRRKVVTPAKNPLVVGPPVASQGKGFGRSSRRKENGEKHAPLRMMPKKTLVGKSPLKTPFNAKCLTEKKPDNFLPAAQAKYIREEADSSQRSTAATNSGRCEEKSLLLQRRNCFSW